jgi:NitT/TauT family transport system substrate-binding protein
MPRGVIGRVIRTRVPAVATAIALASALTSCSLLGGSDEGSDSASGGKGGDLEKSTIKVSVMKTTDLAPFHLAVKEGYFKDEGLEVETVDAKSSDESSNKLVAGDVDIAYSSYTPFFLAQSKNSARAKGGIKLVADAASASPNSCVIVATPDSSVKSVKDLAGKRIAVTGPGSVATLLTMSTLRNNGVDYSDVDWIPTPFPQTAVALKQHNVDAAFVTDPFIQDSMKKAGAQPIIDTATGPTEDFPVAGYASTGDFTKANPKTIAAFQRAMQRGTELAESDRGKVEPMLVQYSGVDEDTAKLATLLNFQSKLDASRLQRVPDLMKDFKVIHSPLDVKSMIVPTAPLDEN